MMFSIKRLLPRSLFGRSLLILVTPVILIQIISTHVFFDRHWNKMSARLAFAVAGEIAMIADYVDRNSETADIDSVAAYAAHHLNFLVSFEKDKELEELGVSSNLSVKLTDQAKQTVLRGFLTRALDEQLGYPHHVWIDMDEKWIEISLQLDRGVMHVSLPQKRMFSSSGYVFLIWMFGVSLLLLIVAVVFMRNQVRPIRRLAIVAERLGKGRDVPSSFKPEGAREVRQAAKAFLDMQRRIRRQIEQRTAMLAGISHDLRTPLTRMKLQTAMMEGSPDATALQSDIADMERMINAYLEFVRGEGREQSERVNLKLFLEELKDKTKRDDIEINWNVSGALSLPLKPLAFERCMNNLISNASRHADHLWIVAKPEDSNVIIMLDDDGPGIPADKREEVFRPFYRGEESRNPATGGVGLGLPIVQDIVHAHGGEITLSDSAHGGLRITIILPL